MKTQYIQPLLEVIEFDSKDDIITTSGDPEDILNKEADPWYSE